MHQFLTFIFGITLLKGTDIVIAIKAVFVGHYICFQEAIAFTLFTVPLNHTLIFSPLGIAMCKPYITGPTPIICPGNNETLVFTCRDSPIFYLSWSAQPNYERFDKKDRITYRPDSEVMKEDERGPFTGKLVGIFNVSNTTTGRPVADMVSTLTISSKGILNGTNISCITWQETDDSELNISITLILAGIYIYIYSCLFLTIHRCLQCIYFFEAIFNISNYREAKPYYHYRIHHVEKQ